MLLPRLQLPPRVASTQSRWSQTLNLPHDIHSIHPRPSFQTPHSPFLVIVRHATHGAQGRANGPKNGAGRRLGAKKTGDEYVIPGNIIFRQRGTKWFPGDNCGMGRDHTIFALQTGYVKYYLNPRLHPKRRYIGVVFEKHESLPVHPMAIRRRRLGMIAVPRTSHGEVQAQAPGAMDLGLGLGEENKVGRLGGRGTGMLSVKEAAKLGGISVREMKEKRRQAATGRVPPAELSMKSNYSYREANSEIGRAAERAGVKVREYQRGDRFLAWRKKVTRMKANAKKKPIGGRGKKGAKKK